MPPSDNKVKALVLADLATSAARHGDYDRVQSLSQQAAHIAIRTEASLAIDRLWDLVESLPASGTGTASQTMHNLTEQLLSSQRKG